MALLTVEEAADLLRVKVSWLYERTRTNEVPHLKLGKYLRFDEEELRAGNGGETTSSRTTMRPGKGGVSLQDQASPPTISIRLVAGARREILEQIAGVSPDSVVRVCKGLPGRRLRTALR